MERKDLPAHVLASMAEQEVNGVGFPPTMTRQEATEYLDWLKRERNYVPPPGSCIAGNNLTSGRTNVALGYSAGLFEEGLPIGTIEHDETGRPFVTLDSGERLYLNQITTGHDNILVGTKEYIEACEAKPEG
jgi:hypothetical protein